MKNLLWLLAILFSTNLSLFSQVTTIPEKKIYQNKENHKLYTNRHLGTYIWISNSPDPNCEKVLLTSDSSKKYSNPLYFDTEGYNTVRSPSAVDTVTRKTIYPLQDIIFEVYADGQPPISKPEHKSLLKKVMDNKTYYGPDLEIALKSTDANSGVKTLLFALNSTSFLPYTLPLHSFNEGENILKFYAFDEVGNVEIEKEDHFYIDKTTPKTTYEVTGILNEKFVAPDATIKLSAKDNLSGVKAIYYRINNGSFLKYSLPIAVSTIGAENGSVSFYAEDNLGNKEDLQKIGNGVGNTNVQTTGENLVFEFYVDNDPPKVNITVDGPLLKGKLNYISPKTSFLIVADDEKAGVDKIYYSINNTNVNTEYSQPISQSPEGSVTLRIKAVDYVGNNSPTLTNTYFCDNKTPISKINITGPKYESRDTLFISSNTLFSISTTDDQSGIASSLYTLSGGTQVNYNIPFSINIPGMQSVSFNAIDKVGNIEPSQSIKVFVDNQPPKIHTQFSVTSIGSKTVRDESYIIYPINAKLYIASTDASSGSDKITYTINNGAVLSANPIQVSAIGDYEIEVKAYDFLGNMVTEKIKFSIEK